MSRLMDAAVEFKNQMTELLDPTSRILMDTDGYCSSTVACWNLLNCTLEHAWNCVIIFFNSDEDMNITDACAGVIWSLGKLLPQRSRY